MAGTSLLQSAGPEGAEGKRGEGRVPAKDPARHPAEIRMMGVDTPIPPRAMSARYITLLYT